MIGGAHRNMTTAAMMNSNESEYGSRLLCEVAKTRSFDFQIEISFKITCDYHRRPSHSITWAFISALTKSILRVHVRERKHIPRMAFCDGISRDE